MIRTLLTGIAEVSLDVVHAVTLRRLVLALGLATSALVGLGCVSAPAPQTSALPAAAASATPSASAPSAPARGFAAEFPHAAVACDHEIASRAGAEMLAAGGNAVDAAVAASFALSVVRPYSCGIGGGGFMVIALRGDPTHGDVLTTLDYRETTPQAIGPDFYEKLPDARASTHGGTAVAVPGTVRGLLEALERFGTLPRDRVLAPAIRAARAGFLTDEHFQLYAEELTAKFRAHPGDAERFAFVWERYLRRGAVTLGDRVTSPEQARLLEQIAAHGAAAFYAGPVADAIVAAIGRDGGVLSTTDLAGYRPVEQPPLVVTSGGRRFVTMAPPSSGGIALAQTFGILEQFGDWADPAHPWDARAVHLFTEALKHAFADRATWLGDASFAALPLTRLLSPEYLAARAAKIDPQHTHPPDWYGTRPPAAADHGTSHISVVDAHGSAVACTETLNLAFGSLLAVPEYGLILNDEMDDFLTRRGQANAFHLTQSDANLPAPGKRPLSSMTPTIVFGADGAVAAVAGASGGPRIISGTAEALVNAVVYDLDAGACVARPRFHHQWMPDELLVEKEWTAQPPGRALIDELRARGHTVKLSDAIGNVQLIRRARGGHGWDAACDPRKGGRPAGM